MSRAELNHRLDFESVPSPGTLTHLEWLANLELPPVTNAVELAGFFAYTNATRSLANLIRNHRTYRPIISPTVDLDTRLYEINDPSIPNFRGTVNCHPGFSDRSHLAFTGGVPHGQEMPAGEYNYQFFIPINYNLTYDAHRPSEASFVYADEAGTQHRRAYVPSAYPEYGLNDPQIMVEAVQHAAADMLKLLNHLYDWVVVPYDQKEYESIPYKFNPEGLNDDPYELVPDDRRGEFTPTDSYQN